MGRNREFFWRQEGYEGKGAAKVAQRDCRRHSCCLLRVEGAGLGLPLRRIESLGGGIFLGDSEGSL